MSSETNKPKFSKNYVSQSHYNDSTLPITHSIQNVPQMSISQRRNVSPAPKIFDLQGLSNDNTLQLLKEQALDAKKAKADLSEKYDQLQKENSNLQKTIEQLTQDNLVLKYSFADVVQNQIINQHSQQSNMINSSQKENGGQLLQINEQQEQSDQFLKHKLDFQNTKILALEQSVISLQEENSIQKVIIEMQKIQIEGLKQDKQSSEIAMESHKIILQNKNDHHEKLIQKIKNIQIEHQRELQQLHSDTDIVQNKLYETLSEKVLLSKNLQDAKNHSLLHQSFADKNLSKYHTLQEEIIQSQIYINTLEDRIQMIVKENPTNNQY